MSFAQERVREATAGQTNMFAEGAMSALEVNLRPQKPRAKFDDLADEREALGVYLSAHPLVSFEEAIREKPEWLSIADVEEAVVARRGPQIASVPAVVHGVQKRRSKSGNRFAFVGLSDPSGVFEGMVFSDVLLRCEGILVDGQPVLAKVSVTSEGGDIRWTITDISTLEAALLRKVDQIRITCQGLVADDIQHLRAVLTAPGDGGRRLEVSLDLLMQLDGYQRLVRISLGQRFVMTQSKIKDLSAIPSVLGVQVH